MTVRRIHSVSPWEQRLGYCRSVVVDGWVLMSGCTGMDAASQIWPPDVETQCRNTIARIKDSLAEAGCSLADVVRVHYILPSRADFEKCWDILGAEFAAAPPAATMIEAGLIVPEALIEIEVTARLPQ